MSAYRKLKSAQQRKFVDLLVRRTNGTDAIRQIKAKCKRPDVLAAKWKARKEIREAIEERTAEAMEEAGINNAQILLGIARMANISVKQLVKEDGTPKKIHELDDETARVIQGIDVDADGTIKFKLPSRLEAHKLLGQYLKLWTQNIHHSGTLTLEQLLAASQQGSDDSSDS